MTTELLSQDGEDDGLELEMLTIVKSKPSMTY